MDVGFFEAGAGHADEFGFFLHLGHSCGAGIAHGSAQAADHLVHDIGDWAFVGDATFDAFGHQFIGLVHLALEIAVSGAFDHGADRAHAAV